MVIYTPGLDEALIYAAAEAMRCGHAVGPEHLLYGLLQQPCLAAKALEEGGASASEIKGALEELLAPERRQEPPVVGRRPPKKSALSKAAKAILDQAEAYAKGGNHAEGDCPIVTTDYLLLALAIQESAASRLLSALGFCANPAPTPTSRPHTP